jgi:hypothetical protein
MRAALVLIAPVPPLTPQAMMEPALPKTFYLYCLEFPNGKKYIGLSDNPDRRFREHCRHAAANTGRNPVHAAIRKHGLPKLHKLCIGGQAYIAELEINAIGAFRTRNDEFGYNVSLGGNLSPSVAPEVAAKISAAQKSARNLAHLAKLSAANKGRKHPPRSPEARANQSASQRGKIRGPMTPERRAKISATKKGRPLGPMSLERRAELSAAHMGKAGTRNGMINSPDARAKVSAALKGRKHSPEHRANNSASKKGRPIWSIEARARMSITRTGRKLHPHSIETRAKISAAKMGHIHSPETRARMSAAHKGRKKSPEHLAAIAAAKAAKRQLRAE